MAFRPQPKNVFDILENIEKRLRNLETTPSVGFSVIPQGSRLVVTDATGLPVVRMGTVSTGGYGIEYWNGAGWTALASHASGDPAGL